MKRLRYRAAGLVSLVLAVVAPLPASAGEPVNPAPRSPISAEETHVETRPRWGIIAAGVAGLLVGYGFWSFGLKGPCPTDEPEDKREWGSLCGPARIPVVGPFLGTGHLIGELGCDRGSSLTCTGQAITQTLALTATILDALVQAAGVVMIGAGFLYPERRVVRTPRTSVTIRPVLSPLSYGVAGTF